jgi:ribosomal protein L11 methyltransferase
MNKWYEMTLTASRDFLPNLSGLLMSRNIKTWAEEEVDGNVRLRIYVPHLDGIEENVKSLERMLRAEKVETVTREIEDEDWAASWQKFFQVVRFGRRIVIKPPWLEYDEQGQDIVLELEPRMAFGSGYHPTTALTLILLEKHLSPGTRVLDVGCGSGILGIAAARLGASSITMTDNDPICTRESEENYRNARQKHPHITGDVNIHLCSGFDRAEGEFGMILLNISTDFIQSAAGEISRRLSAGGLFISGSILPERRGEVESALGMHGLSLMDSDQREGWAGAVFVKA